MKVLDCLGSAPSEAQLIGEACEALPGTALLLHCEAASSDPYESWVLAGVIAVVERLQALLSCGESELHPVTVVCSGTPGEPAAAEALFEAVRGVVQSVTLERRTRHLRCNVLRTPDVRDGRAIAALRYLASEAGAFALGSTLDLSGGR